jgi:NAD-dependent DNA ligase
VAVHWAPSYQGYLIPRIEIEPVVVGSATITFLTGHNAKNIKDKKIGPGAKIRIRRSGDVIPTLDAVLVPTVASMPEGEHVWDATETHLKGVGSDDLVSPRLRHFVKTLEVEGMGPGMVDKLVEKGVKGPKDLYALSVEKMSEILGPTNGQKIHRALRLPFQKGLSEMKIMISSGLMPRSVGETKLKVLFAVEPEWRNWKRYAGSCESFESWSIGSFTEFLKVLPAYEQWRSNEFPTVTTPSATIATVVNPTVATVVTPTVTPKGTLCFTGFRNKEFEAQCVQKGYTVSDTVTKKTNFLVIPDTEGYTSTKVDKAKASGVTVVSFSNFQKTL